MKPQFELERNTAVINFSAHYCNTEDELLNSQGFERVLTRFLKKLKIYKYFDQIAISSNYKIKKPNKEFYLKALSAFKVKKAYMIGNDYECDIKPALELGLKPIFIKSNLTPKDQFKHYGLDGFDYLKILSLVGVN